MIENLLLLSGFSGFHWLSALINTLVIIPLSEQFCSLSFLYLIFFFKKQTVMIMM